MPEERKMIKKRSTDASLRCISGAGIKVALWPPTSIAGSWPISLPFYRQNLSPHLAPPTAGGRISARSCLSPRTAPGPGQPRLAPNPARPGRVSHRRRSVAGGLRRARRPGGRCRSSGRRRTRRAAAAGGRSRGRAAATRPPPPPPPRPRAARRRPSAPPSPWLPAAACGTPSLVHRLPYGEREGPAPGGKAFRGGEPREELGEQLRGREVGEAERGGRAGAAEAGEAKLGGFRLARFRAWSWRRSAGRNH